MGNKKMSIWLAVFFIFITGCSSNTQNKSTEISTEQVTETQTEQEVADTATESNATKATTEGDTEEQATVSDGKSDYVYAEYYELIDKIGNGIENGFAENEIDELGISSLFGLNIDFSDYGYRIMDVDGNGIDELVLGENGSGGWNGVIYNMYTLIDGKMVRVIDGWDRNRYYLCENGVFANEGSSGAGSSTHTYYSYIDGELKIRESVIYDGYKDAENPWFYSTESDDVDKASNITADEAEQIISTYQYKQMNFTPFPMGDLITYFEAVTVDVLDACASDAIVTSSDAWVSYYYNAPLILLNRFDDDIRLYGINIGEDSAMILYKQGEKVLIDYSFWNVHLTPPKLNVCDWDGDGEDEIIISRIILTGTGVHKDALLVCDCEDAWNIYEYDDYSRDIESIIAYQYDESTDTIIFSNKEDGTVLAEIKLPEWAAEYPYSGSIDFTGLIVRFDVETLKMEVIPGISMENSMPYTPIKIICDISYMNGEFKITDYEIQDAGYYEDDENNIIIRG